MTLTAHGTASIEALRSRVRGRLCRAGDEGYDDARAAWNLNAQLRPAVVVMAKTAMDVRDAVRFARRQRLGVAVMATGHGAAPCDGGLLVNTTGMRRVDIDPARRTARVSAGAMWVDVVREAAVHELAGLPGSSARVGVVGYTMGGGFGWLGRRYGLAANSVTRAEVVTADGEVVVASAEEHPDLLWGLKGGAGNFGIVTALEFRLHPVPRVYAGNLYYPVHRAAEILDFYSRWHRTLPDEMTAAATFRAFPPVPTVPDGLRGRSLVAVRGCYCGSDSAVGAELVAQARATLGAPDVDTFAVIPTAALDSVSLDPVSPIAARGHCELLRDLTPEAVRTLAELGPNSPLVMLEVRQLGGALTPSASALSPLGHSDARFTVNAIGATPTPEQARLVRSHLGRLAQALRPHATGGTYVNFLDPDVATPEHVRAAFSADDWSRLVALKDRYDPHNLFRFNRNIPPSGDTR